MKLVILTVFVVFTSSFMPYLPRPVTVEQKRDDYVASLKSYEGMNYARYGDDSGISCSTLIRRAFVETNGLDGPSRAFIDAHPCDSDEMESGCGGQLTGVLKADSLKSLDYSRIEEGDIAIIGNDEGLHAMAYIGNETWIHADPITEKVIEIDEPEENDDWVTFRVNVMRWNALR
ncbi:MAG: C40 family peptidase [Acidobacteria bacterium]|nr:C40 family peptidase [Acidobacteriota bacterium]